MRRAIHDHAEALLAHELARARGLSPQQRRRVARTCSSVAAAVVEAVLDEARGEQRLAAALASIYGSEPLARTTLPAWPVEAARRA
jgi:hypothetical protein